MSPDTVAQHNSLSRKWWHWRPHPSPECCHLDKICQCASSRAKNGELKLLGKLRLMSEFPLSESRRQLSRRQGEIWPGCGCPDWPDPSSAHSPKDPEKHLEAGGCWAQALQRHWEAARAWSLHQLAAPIGALVLGVFWYLVFWVFLVPRYTHRFPPCQGEPRVGGPWVPQS